MKEPPDELTSPSRTALADFLKSRRHRLQPETNTSGMQRRRRTPGLRREEVAELAGISVDWYIRLEQGKADSASSQTAEGLIRALKLTQEDAHHLKTLMNCQTITTPSNLNQIPSHLEQLVRCQSHPTYLQNTMYDVLVWNDSAEALFGFSDTPAEDRNVLTYLFADPRSRDVFGNQWAEESARVLAQFRRVFDRTPNASAASARLTKLLKTSPEFTQAWKQHDIHFRSSGTKHLIHPEKGHMDYQYHSLRPDGFEDLSLVILMAINNAGDLDTEESITE